MKFTFEPEARPLDGYTIKRAIDRGGFGEVYYALSDSGKEVALKLLQRNADVELRGITQCLNLKHPNLITLFDVKEDSDGAHWVIMEYVSGKSLDQVIAQAPHGLPVADVENWLSQMCAGAAYLHDRGIVHRDLKPANVFIENGHVKIGDVGLAKSMTPSHRSAHTESVGTVYYMAPEVSKGKYGHEIDVYSLGVMLYEMLTGEVPFSGESAGEILMKHLTEKPDLSRLPAQFRTVVAHALQKDPLLRTPSAADLAKEFRAAVRGSGGAQVLEAADFVAKPRPKVPQPYVLTDKDIIRPKVKKKSNPFAETTLEPAPRSSRPPTAAFVLGRWFWALALIAFGVALVSSRGGHPIGAITIGGITFFVGWGIVTFLTWVAHAARVPEPRPTIAQPRRRVSPYASSPDTPRNLSWTHRIEDLTASMTKSTIWSITLAALAYFGMPNLLDLHILDEPQNLGLFTLTTILAAWTILLPTKLMWEGSEIPASARRFVLGSLGAFVGAAAFWIHDSLLVDRMNQGQSNGPFDSVIGSVGSHSLLDPSGQPTLAAFVLFFTALFALRRWWWRADSFRSSHFHVGSIILTTLLGFLLTAVIEFPTPWAAVWAGTIATVLQLSSGFTPVKQRASLLEVN